MLVDLSGLLERYITEIEVVLIETPAPQQGKRQAHKGQAMYGMAVGHVRCHLLHYWHAQPGMTAEVAHNMVRTVRADEWTRQVSKKHRQMCIAQQVPSYDPEQDKGGDVADAIGMVWWWAAEQRLRT